MQPQTASAPLPAINLRFSRGLLIFNAGIPLALVAWDALHHQLGADPVNEAIHTTGWLALFFLTASLAVSPLRKLTGLGWLVSMRRTLGVYGFVYAASHLSIYFWWDRSHSLRSTWTEITSKPFIMFGASAIVLLAPLAVTSTNGMISLLGNARWKWLHTLAYPATALAAVHYLLEGKIVTLDKKVFAASVGALLLFRWFAKLVSAEPKPSARVRVPAALAPAAPTAPARKRPWRGQLKVARITRETPSVQTFRLTLPEGGPLPFEHLPGQYLSLSLDIGGKKVPRSYTIASAPTQRDYVELTIKREEKGLASRHLHDTLREGDVLPITAPAGKFFFTGVEAPSVVLIGGGVGITPLMSIARALTDRGWTGDIDLFYSVRAEGELIFAAEIERLRQRFPNFKPHLSITGSAVQPSSTWTGLRARIDQAMLLRFVPDLAQRIAYVCGPTPMLEPMRAILRAVGMPEDRIRFEEFTSPSRVAATDDTASDASPIDAGTANSGDAPAGEAAITFARSGVTAQQSGDKTVLETAEDAGVEIPFDCRAGTCGTCKTRLTSGHVTMESQDALTKTDKKLGLILACQAHAAGDISVDA